MYIPHIYIHVKLYAVTNKIHLNNVGKRYEKYFNFGRNYYYDIKLYGGPLKYD